MNRQIPQTAHQSAPGLPGTWKLVAGRAITLQPREAGKLRIAHGSIWATHDGPHQGALNDLGDVVLEAGQHLSLARGERLVIEAWGNKAPAYFSWDPVPQQQRVPIEAVQLGQSLRDLRCALLLGARGTAGLVAALAGLAWGLVRARDNPGHGATQVLPT